MAQILALGDCNTLGTKHLEGNAYPEEFALKIGKSVRNCGFTMSSTNEMLHFYQTFKEDNPEIVLIQYGLVDSWRTFRYAPYILYYPDNLKRKVFRKLVKKYKKIGLNKLLGVKNIVPIKVYKKNIESIIKTSKNSVIFLIDTIPNQDTSRNNAIIQYNQILEKLTQEHEYVYYVNVYYDFLDKKEYYLDKIHMNREGYMFITNKLVTIYNQCCRHDKV